KVWGCEALVKRDMPDKLQQRSVKCIFIGYLKETTGYYFYFPPENKIVVARYAEFFEKNLITQEVGGRAINLKEIQDEDTSPSEITSKIPMEVEGFEPPQGEVILVYKSKRTHRAPTRLCLNVEVEEHSLGILMNSLAIKLQLYIFKARLVAKGFTQTYGVDYEETFYPVANIRSIRILIAIAAYYDYEIWQMDVKTTFLNGHLFEEVYMEQPEGFVNPKYPNHVCKLKRSIYGLKQASRQWNKRFDDEIKKFGFTRNSDETCVYLKASGSYIAILILYFDDILLMGNNIPMLQDVKSYIGRSFTMKDLGEASYILGIKIYLDRSKRLIGLCQKAYIEKILKRFYIENSKRGTIPMQEKLKLSKSQGASTPAEKQRMQNIPYASANPGEERWTAVKNILKYLRNTKDMFFVYGGNMEGELRVSCYTDVGYLTDADNLKSQTGYVFVLNGGAEAVWIHIVPTIEEPTSMYCDNTGAIAIAKDDGVTKGARHFRAKVHYLRETIKLGDVKIEKIHTDDNLADPFTKALAFLKHSELTRNIGLLLASSFM
nr:hypothetical protein [Tanacetum cinerariifolium]